MSQIAQVKEATDIVQVIGERVQLTRTGTNLKGLCPFHSEKSPSFFVSETMQRYKCFGCGETGDAFTFLEKYEGLTFYEALTTLADQAGIKLEKATRSHQDDEREQLLQALSLAKEYYHYILTKHPKGSGAQTYLKDRGVTAQSVTLFQIGYALPGWEGLVSYLHKKKKFSLDILEKAGLVIKGKRGRYYDRFRDRVMFPLKDHRGRVVGFSGRTLKPDVKEAKYINSPETALYHKSKMLFGYSELLQEIRKQRVVIVVEGELDVISSTQAHVNHVVAIKGSALTEDHAQLLERVADQVLLALDTDSAGVEATKRAIAVSKTRRYELRVVQLPDGKDPDDLVKKDPKLWRDAVKKTSSVVDFFIAVALKNHDPTTPEGKRNIMKEVGPAIASVQHAVERDFYVKKVAELLEVKERLVREDLQMQSQKAKPKVKRPVAKDAAETVETPAANSPKEIAQSSSHDKLELLVLRLLLSSRADVLENRFFAIKDIVFSHPLMSRIMAGFDEYYHHKKPNQPFSLAAFSQSRPADEQQFLFELSVLPEFANADHQQSVKEWPQAVSRLKKISIQTQVQNITTELEKLDSLQEKSAQQEQEQQDLLEKIVQLRKTL